MALKEAIQEDLKESLREKDELRSSVLRMVMSSLHNQEIEKKTKLRRPGKITAEEVEKQGQLTDDEIIDVIFSEIKKRKEAILEFSAHTGSASGGDKTKIDNAINKEKKELEILQKYLPEQLSEQNLKNMAKEAIDKLGAKEMKDMGRVLAELMSKVKGKAEGSLVSKVVKELLLSKSD